jgi:hypothetical protein
VAATVVGRHGNEADKRWLEDAAKTEADPFLVRAFMVGLRHRGKVEKALTAQIVRRHPELEITADYLNGRGRLPSMVYAKRKVAVP